MDMAFGYNDTFIQLEFPLWPDQSTSRGAFQITGLPDHAFNAQTSCICDRNFHLCFPAAWPEYDDLFKSSFRSGDSQPFFAGILAGLA